jgi:uroporphyrinogen-III decarboxylase
VPVIGAESKTCFQSLIEKWVGTVKLTYLLADEPQAVEDCLASMRRISDQTAELSVLSPCEAFIFWEDSSTTNISPTMFQKYVAPEISTWGRTLRAAGKLLIHHACGHLRALLQQMGELPIDAIESISPPPTGNIDIEEAYSLLPSHITLIGGIEPVFFENCTSEELDVRVNELLRITRGKRYILANSDSCPPGVEIEKFSQVSVLVKKSSQKPV